MHVFERGESRAKTQRFIMVGGFLGAGKTTCILKLARWLSETKKLRVGIITNDQASGLVDTALARNADIVTEEISGGCFCCRSGSLIKATEHLTVSHNPDVFLAEPVGSCTDLIATVALPLQRVYQKDYAIAPLSVVLDPFRAIRILSLPEVTPESIDVPSFADDINYIFRKQLEEAGVIVINKCELLPNARLVALKNRLAVLFPQAEVFAISARDGYGLEEWWERLLSSSLEVRSLMNIDYNQYGRGEALLGWVNGSFMISMNGSVKAQRYEETSAAGLLEAKDLPNTHLDGTTLLISFAKAIQKEVVNIGAEIAHLKISLTIDEDSLLSHGQSALGVVQLVGNERAPEITQKFTGSISRGSVMVNLRAEADPKVLVEAVERGIFSCIGVAYVDEVKFEAFRPKQPIPSVRVTQISPSEDESA